MEARNQHIDAPFFSICIPQHNRTDFLLEALRVLAEQEFRDFEICIADDCSTDGREQEIVRFLQDRGLAFAFRKNGKNLRYDGNIRAAIGLAKGRYCLLHGNDDCLKGPGALSRIRELIEIYERPGVVVTNFESWNSGQVVRRVPGTVLHPAGAETAARRFRNVAFVTGVTFDRVRALPHATDRWDGSEMYQMYLSARVIATGGTMLEIDESLVRKDILIAGQEVDTHEKLPKVSPCPIIPRLLPMRLIGRAVADGIRPGVTSREQAQRLNALILKQLHVFTLPRWVVDYRRIQSWRYAAGIALGQSTRYTCEGVDLALLDRAKLQALHIATSAIGLTLPARLYAALEPWLHTVAKRS